jgi:hypothetical protein
MERLPLSPQPSYKLNQDQPSGLTPGESGDLPALREHAAGDDFYGSGRRSGRPVGVRGTIPPKLYRIGEIVDYSGVSRQTIHNYTTMGLLREHRRTAGGHRLYDESVFGRLDGIAELKSRRRSIRDICEHFARLDRLK